MPRAAMALRDTAPVRLRKLRRVKPPCGVDILRPSYLVQLRPVAQSANFNTGIRNSGISGPPVPTYRDAASGDVTRSREEPRNGNGFGPSHTDSAAWLNLRCRSALAVHVEVVHRCGRYALR